ncbi:Cytochrome P450 71A9-like protein [Drosera capensis]
MEEVAHVCEVIASSRGPINISELMVSLANSVICREAFGRKDFDEKCKFYELLNEVQEVLGTVNISDFFPWLGWTIKINRFEKKVEKVFKALDLFYDELIDEHRDRSRIGADSSHMDFVDVLVAVQGDDKQVIKLTVDQTKGILMSILTGGTDTSSSILVWTMTELMKSRASMKALKDELTKVANGKDMIEETDFPQLEYLRMVLKESFRLHPPVLLVPRETIQDCEIRGYEIPANTRVFLNVGAISRDPNTWEDPLIFRPERFLNSSIDFRGQDLELIPFGVGRRGCPGINMALPLVELALANLGYRFDWNMPPGMSPDDIDMEDSLGVTIQKKRPLMLVASPRTPLRT